MKELKLDNTSYVHKQSRLLCLQLELLTNLKCITNLSEEFHEIRFKNELSYIVIDFKREAVYTMSYELDDKEWQTVDDILLHTTWLYIGYNYEELALKRERRIKRARRNKRKIKKSSKKNWTFSFALMLHLYYKLITCLTYYFMIDIIVWSLRDKALLVLILKRLRKM